MFPSVTFPIVIKDVRLSNLSKVQENSLPGPYTESPRSVPAQMRTPSDPPHPFMQSALSYECLITSANQLPAADYINSVRLEKESGR